MKTLLPRRVRQGLLHSLMIAMLIAAGATTANAADVDLHELLSPREARDLWLPGDVSGLGAAPLAAPFVLGTGSNSFSGIYGADVSHHNTDPNCSGANCKRCEIDWTKASDQGVRFVYMKATTGTGSPTKPDAGFPIYWKELEQFHRSGRVYRGAYHWLTSDLTSGVDQAKHFLTNVKVTDIQLAPVVDFEEDPVVRDQDYYDAHHDTCKVVKRSTGEIYYACDGWVDVSKADRLTKLTDWLDTIAKASPRKPIVYTRTNYWQNMLDAAGANLIAKYSVWLAQYPKEPRKWHDEHPDNGWKMPMLPKNAAYPAGGSGDIYGSRNFWQFTERGKFSTAVTSCNGVPQPDRGMDMNWYPSSIVDFQRAFQISTP